MGEALARIYPRRKIRTMIIGAGKSSDEISRLLRDEFATDFELLGLMLLATHASGFPVVIVHIALRILFHGLRYFGLVLVFVLAMAISSVGVKSDQAPGDIRLLLAEVKCIVQDEDADVSVYDWNYLKNISPVENWLLAVPCDDIDKSVIALGK